MDKGCYSSSLNDLQEGNVYLYSIPRLESAQPLTMASTDAQKEEVARKAMVSSVGMTDDLMNEEVIVQRPQVSKWDEKHVKPLAIFSKEGDEEDIVVGHSTGVYGRLIVTGSRLGKVTAWIVPFRPDTLEPESLVLPWAVSTPGDYWKRNISRNESQTSITDLIPNPRLPKGLPQVTASVIIEELWVLVLGYGKKQKFETKDSQWRHHYYTFAISQSTVCKADRSSYRSRDSSFECHR